MRPRVIYIPITHHSRPNLNSHSKISSTPPQLLIMTIDNVSELASAELEIVKEHQLKEKIVNEEFKIWKKTVPLLYDTIYSHALDFPSLSVKWLPDYSFNDDKSRIAVKFLYGTNSSQHSQDYLKLGSIDIPSTLSPIFGEVNPNVTKLSIPESTTNGKSSFQVLSTWKHNGEVNKLEISPSGQKVLTFDNEGIVHLYNLASDSKECIDFKYHKLEGYALEWLNDGEFLSGSNDSQIALWDVLKPSTPIQCYKSHHAVINDLSLNKQQKSIFGSVSDDYSTQFHDLRSPASDSVAIKINNKHIQNSINFHPDILSLVATGGRDNVVSLYDLRYPKEPFRKLFGHNDSIMGLKWDEFNNQNKLTSWSLDKRVIIWDLDSLDDDFIYPTEANENSRKKNANKVDPCLKFISGGHVNRINEVDIHPKVNGLHITCGDDNLLEVWKPKTLPVDEEEEEEEEQEEEEGEEGEEEKGQEEKKTEHEVQKPEEKKDDEQPKEESNEDVEMKDANDNDEKPDEKSE